MTSPLSAAQRATARGLLQLAPCEKVEAVLLRMAGDGLPPIGDRRRAAIIAEMEQDPEALTKMARDRRVTVRRAVCANRRTPSDARSGLWEWALSAGDVRAAHALAASGDATERSSALTTLLASPGNLADPWDADALVPLSQGVGTELVLRVLERLDWSARRYADSIVSDAIHGVDMFGALSVWVRTRSDGTAVSTMAVIAEGALSVAYEDGDVELIARTEDDALRLAALGPSYHRTLVRHIAERLDANRWAAAWIADGCPELSWTDLHQSAAEFDDDTTAKLVVALAELGCTQRLERPGFHIGKLLSSRSESTPVSTLLEGVDDATLDEVALGGLTGTHRYRLDDVLVARLVANPDLLADKSSSRWSGRVSSSAADALASIDHPDTLRIAILSGAGADVRLRALRQGDEVIRQALLNTGCASLAEARLIVAEVEANPRAYKQTLTAQHVERWTAAVLDLAAGAAGRRDAHVTDPARCDVEVTELIWRMVGCAVTAGVASSWNGPAVRTWVAGLHPAGAPTKMPVTMTSVSRGLIRPALAAWHRTVGDHQGRLPWHLEALVNSQPHVLANLPDSSDEDASKLLHSHVRAVVTEALGDDPQAWEMLAVLAAESDAGLGDLVATVAALSPTS